MADIGKSTMEKFLSFTLGGELFALDIFSVREVLEAADITRIPQTPRFMLGVVNLRGNAVPVIDLGLKFGLGEVRRTVQSRTMILDMQGQEGVTMLGALADSVREVFEIAPEQLDPPPKMGTCIKPEYIRGIGKLNGKFIIILDIHKVFTAAELLSLHKPEKDQ